jgi:hypothetical protein
MMERDPTVEQVIRSAAQMILKEITDLLYADNHYYGERPCATCRSATALAGFPIGCVRYAIDKAAREKARAS